MGKTNIVRQVEKSMEARINGASKKFAPAPYIEEMHARDKELDQRILNCLVVHAEA